MTTNVIRVLKAATCPSLSGKSKLTYEVGCNESEQAYLRVKENNGGGYFSDEWVAWESLQQALEKVPANKALTSLTLRSLFRGKSVNTPAFMLAVLKQEGLVRPLTERSYARLEPKEWQASIQALMTGKEGAAGKPTAKAKKTHKKAAVPNKRKS